MQGRVLAQRQQWDDAIEVLRQALELNTANSDVLTELGLALANQAVLNQDPLTPAIQTLERALAQDPNSARATYYLGLLQAQTGENDAAIVTLERAVDLNPGNAAAYRYLGDLRAQQGDTTTATELYNASLDQDPSQSETYLSLASVAAAENKQETALMNVKTAAVLEQTVRQQDPAETEPIAPIEQTLNQERANTVRRTAFSVELPPATAESEAEKTQSREASRILATAQQENLVDPNQIVSRAGEPSRLSDLDPDSQVVVQSVLFSAIAVLSTLLVSCIGLGSYLVLDSAGLIPKRKSKQDQERELAAQYLRAGIAHMDAQEWEAALQSFQSALNLRRDLAEAHFFSGQVYSKLGTYEEAIVQFRFAENLNPHYPGLRAALVKTFILAGRTLLSHDEFWGAVEKFKAALALFPDGELGDAEAHYYLGLALSRVRSDDAWIEAVNHLKSAITLNPRMAQAYMTLGSVLSLLQQFTEAIKAYKRALALDSQLVGVHHELGQALYRNGELHEAITHFKNVLQLSPNFARVRTELGYAFIQAGRLDDAMNEFDTALKKGPTLAMAQLGIASVHYYRNQLKLATAECERALKMDRNIAATHALQGLIYLDTQKQTGKEKNLRNHRILEIPQAKFESAIKLDIHVAEAHVGLGLLSALKREYAFAIESYTNALRANRSYTNAHIYLGEVYLALRNLGQARSCFEMALSLNPDHAVARQHLHRLDAPDQPQDPVADLVKDDSLGSLYLQEIFGDTDDEELSGS